MTQTETKLVGDAQTLLNASPDAAAILNLGPFKDFAELAGALFTHICSKAIGEIVGKTYAANPHLIDTTLYDIMETARRNFEPGTEAATLLFARGVHAVMAHRVAHQHWQDGDITTALALKSATGRALTTDIHPAAHIDAGLWLDHGLGTVIGETAIIERDVSIWHNVTLGSSLNATDGRRHPHIESSAVIGAGAILLGPITIGAQANIAAGAIVTQDVPKATLAVGTKAVLRGPAGVSFTRPGEPKT